MKYFCYILLSEKDHRFYFGQTNNLEQRLLQHNSGKSTYTKKFIPWKLIAYKQTDTRKEAMKLERMLKNLKGHSKIPKFIERHDFILVRGAENP